MREYRLALKERWGSGLTLHQFRTFVVRRHPSLGVRDEGQTGQAIMARRQLSTFLAQGNDGIYLAYGPSCPSSASLLNV